MVYACYTPYVFLWLHFGGAQYIRWLVGGIPMAIAFNLVFTPVYARLVKRWPVN